jgi:hypothetical protein
MKLFRALLWTQGTYILITAIWPIVHIKSFMDVTGYKTDIWLVKTVGALLIPIGVSLLAHLFLAADRRLAIILGALTAIAFICIDFYYALTDVIPDIYLADGIIEGAFLLLWMYVAVKNKRDIR